MIIGLASYRFINNDIPFNISQIEKAMKLSRGKADLICFGEAFLQGFDAFHWKWEEDRNIAIDQNSGAIKELCANTVKYGVDLLLAIWKK